MASASAASCSHFFLSEEPTKHFLLWLRKCFPHASLQFAPVFVCTLPLCSSNGQDEIAVVSCYLKEGHGNQQDAVSCMFGAWLDARLDLRNSRHHQSPCWLFRRSWQNFSVSFHQKLSHFILRRTWTLESIRI